MRNFTVTIVCFLILVTCTREEVAPRNYPRLKTKSVENISVSGAIFYGEIINTPQAILDHGFLWSDKQVPSFSGSEKISLGGTSGAGNFRSPIERSLAPEKKYYVRAYAKTERYTVYGDVQEFFSLGSKAPEITEITPAEATWKDTVVIVGKNFSDLISKLTVKLDTVRCEIIKATPTSIQLIVPPALANGPSSVSVSFYGNAGVKDSSFQLTKPTIETISPSVGSTFTLVSIKGKFFSPTHTKIFFNSIEVKPNTVSEEEIKIQVPEGLSEEDVKLIVKTGSGNLEGQSEFKYRATRITGITPLSGTYGDLLTIKGENFPTVTGLNTVHIGNSAGKIISVSANEIKVEVPENLNTPENEISLKYGNTSLIFSQKFSLLPPEITGLSSSTATINSRITITGRNFSSFQNQVLVGGLPAQVISNAKGEIVTTLSYQNLTSHDLTVQVLSSTQISNGNYTLKNPWMQMADFPNGINSEISFTAENQVFVIGRNNTGDFSMHAYDNSSRKWIKKNSGPLGNVEFTLTSGFVIGAKIYLSNDFGEFWQYDILSNEWLRKNDLPIEKFSFYGGTINGKGYLIGGGFGAGASRQIWEFDPANDGWTRKNDSPFEWAYRTFEFNGKLYAFSGSSETISYDPANDIWSRERSLDETYLFVIDGKTYTPNHYMVYEPVVESRSEIVQYDISTGEYRYVTLFCPGSIYNMNFSMEGKGYIINGNSFWELDPSYADFK